MRNGASPRRLTPNRRLESTPRTSPLELDNGLLIDGRPGAEPRWNHKDRSARPVRCSAGLFDTASQPQCRLIPIRTDPGNQIVFCFEQIVARIKPSYQRQQMVVSKQFL